jgi:hypothetical protein
MGSATGGVRVGEPLRALVGYRLVLVVVWLLGGMWVPHPVMAAGGERSPAITADASADSSVESRAAWVIQLFNDEALDHASLFTPEFLATVPPEKLTSILEQYRAQCGSVTRLVRVDGGDRHRGTFEGHFSKGWKSTIRLSIDASPPNRIAGLRFGTPVPIKDDFKALTREMEALSGQTGFLVVRHRAGQTEVLASHQAVTARAVGSVFKLWVLGALITEVTRGAKRWDEVVLLDTRWRSLPSGFLQTWPSRAPITLYTLAALMMSQSDNTATDALIHILGRNRVIRAMIAMGCASSAKNRPLLTTRDMFRLKLGDAFDLHKPHPWATMTEAARNQYLQTALPDLPPAGGSAWRAPRFINEVEWFASAQDVANALVWLRSHTQQGASRQARDLLAINSGLLPDSRSKPWSYLGYKGGSEPGVLACAYLLETSGGDWYTVTAAWNDAVQGDQSAAFNALISRTLALLATPE